MEVKDTRTLLLGLMVFFYISHLARFISQVFVLNFSTSGLNPSIALILMFLSGILFFIFDQTQQFPNTLNRFLVLTIVIFNVVSLVNFSIVSLMASLIGMALILAAIIQLSGKDELRTGFALGLALNIAFQTVFTGLNPYATLLTKIAFIVLTVIYFVIHQLNYGKIQNDPAVIDMSRVYLVQSILVFSAVFLAFPYVVASWANESISLLSIIMSTEPSLLQYLMPNVIAIAGIIATLLSRFAFPLPSILLKIVFLVGIFLLVNTSYLPIISYILVVYGIINFIPNEETTAQKHVIGLGLIIVQLLLLMLLFLQVASGHWVFLPSAVHGILQGFAWLYLMIISLFTVIWSLLEARA